MVWPFRRKNKKAASRSTAVSKSTERSDALGRAPSHRSSRHSKRRRKTSPRGSTASMHDVEKDGVLLPDPLLDIHPALRPQYHQYHHRRSSEDLTALPVSRRLEQSPHLRPVTNEHGIPYNFQPNSLSQSSLARERGKLQRPQSLRKPVTTDSSLVRRKSSKKREHDHLREEEIRAMSMPLPQKRSADRSGGMLRRESKKAKGGLNHRFERPTSDVSLPLEDSIHSSMSGSSESRAFRVSALDMFSPRPKIRYSVGSQHYYGGDRSSPVSHQEKQQARREHRATSSREDNAHKRSSRIDDLADTLDAGALREILDKDKRRKEKRRKAEDERMRRRLERRAEKQRQAEKSGTPARPGTPGTPRIDATGSVVGSGAPVGLGIAKDTPAPMEDVRPTTPTPAQRSTQRLHDATALTPPAQAEENSQLPTPLESPVEETAQAVRYSRASMSSPRQPSHHRGPSNVSEMPALLSEMAARESPVDTVEPAQDPNASGSLHPVETADTAATSKKGSSRRRSSEGRRMGMIASFFRRGKRSSQETGRTPPNASEVSFSNTSRESMSRQPLPAHLVASQPTQPIQIRRPSSVPHRTMSKFREDLPEFPLSPPDSRVQSPEVSAPRHRSQPPGGLRVDSNSPAFGSRTDSPVSPGVPAAGVMSQSLASVDSEGSWLSGKPMKRVSNKSQFRSSVGSATALPKRNEEFTASYEELGIPDDEYFKRLTPQPDERRRSVSSADMLARKPSSTAMALETPGLEDDLQRLPSTSSDEELVKSGVARQPTIVHRQARVKSREGLLSYYTADHPSPEAQRASLENAESPDSQESPASEGEPAQIQRAKSVDLGKHHSRQLSAGSAKLLDIPARRASTSVDPKRSSIASQNATSEQ